MSDPWSDLLTSTDLDALAVAYDAVTGPDPSDRCADVVAAWTDVQAVANLLMCASVLPAEIRTDALLRGLREPGYLQLAAAVGVGRLTASDVDGVDGGDGVRRELLDALLDLVAGDAGPAGVRASAEIPPLLRVEELELLDDLAGHPVDAVRHNLEQARLGLTAPEQRVPVLLPYLPDYVDYVAAS